MKKTICLLFIIFCGKITTAQVIIALLFGDKLNSDKLEFGLTVGPTLSKIQGIDCKAKAGLNLGLYFTIKLGNNFYFQPEAIAKSSFGARGILPYSTGNDSLDNLFAEGSVERNIKMAGLVTLVQYRIMKKLFIEAGPQATLRFKARDIFEVDIEDNKLSYVVNITDKTTLFDVGITGGMFYKLKEDKGMRIGIRYYYGFVDVLKPSQGGQQNSVWLLNISIPVGTSKSARKAKQNKQ